MRSQGWCGEARLQVSEEGAVSGRLTRDGGTVSVTSFECRDETSRLDGRDGAMRGDGGGGDGGGGREGGSVGSVSKERVDAHG
jgi:hypothetical protein